MLNVSNFTNQSAESTNIANLDIIVVCILLIVILISVSLNGFMLVVYILFIKKRTFSNWLFISNSIVDLFNGIFTIPVYIASLLKPNWEVGDFLCIFGYIADYSNNDISIYNLVIMSFHRYFQLKFPLKTNEKMGMPKYALLGSVWFLVVLFWTINVNVNAIGRDKSKCEIDFSMGIVIFADLSFYIIPLVLVIISNSLTFIELKKRNKISHELDLQNKHQIRPFLCLACVSLTMIVCFLPYSITFPISKSCLDCLDPVLKRISLTLSYFIGAINPIIIITFQESFRNEFVKFISCKFKK
jgi:hypothetical protein